MRLINSDYYPQMDILLRECVNNIFNCQVFDQNGEILSTPPDFGSGYNILESESAIYRVQLNCIDVVIDDLMDNKYKYNMVVYRTFCHNLSMLLQRVAIMYPHVCHMPRFIGGYAGSRLVGMTTSTVIVIPFPTTNMNSEKCIIRFSPEVSTCTYAVDCNDNLPDMYYTISLWSTYDILGRFRYLTNPIRISDGFVSRDLGFIMYSGLLASSVKSEIVQCPTISSLKIASQVLGSVYINKYSGVHAHLIRLEGSKADQMAYTCHYDTIPWEQVPDKSQDRCRDCNVLLYGRCLLTSGVLVCGRCNRPHRQIGSFVSYPRTFEQVCNMMDMTEKTHDMLIAANKFCTTYNNSTSVAKSEPVTVNICGSMLNVRVVPNIKSIYSLSARNIERTYFIIATE